MAEKSKSTEKSLSTFFSTHNLKLIQAASGSAFGTFALLHLGNIAAAHFQASGFNNVERIVRYYYQNPILEPLLIIGSLGVHAISSYILVFRRWKKQKNAQTEPVDLSETLHRLSGYFLSVSVPIHALATRLPSLLYGPDYSADFSLISFTLRAYPWFFYPYFYLLGSSGLYHAVFGGLKSIDRFFRVSVSKKIVTNKFFLPVIGALSLVICSALLAFGGVYFNIPKNSFSLWKKLFEDLFSGFGPLKRILLPWQYGRKL